MISDLTHRHAILRGVNSRWEIFETRPRQLSPSGCEIETPCHRELCDWFGHTVRSFVSTSLRRRETDCHGWELIEYGVYLRPNDRFEKRIAGSEEKPQPTAGEIELIRRANVINATVDTTFGIVFMIVGAPAKAPVEGVIELTHPRIANPTAGQATRQSSTCGH